MTRISTGLGGTRTMRYPTGTQDWRQPPAAPRQSVDWSDQKYATPQPAPKFKYPRHPTIPIGETPQLPERTIRVRARPPATYYTPEGMPIPADEWVKVPISPGILKAIAVGDLEEDKTVQPTSTQPHPQPQHQRRERPPSPPAPSTPQ